MGQWQDGIRADQVIRYSEDDSGVITTTGSTGAPIASTVLSFDSDNVTKLNQIQDMYAFLNGSRVKNDQHNQIMNSAPWGFWNGPLVDATGLAQSECSDNSLSMILLMQTNMIIVLVGHRGKIKKVQVQILCFQILGR